MKSNQLARILNHCPCRGKRAVRDLVLPCLMAFGVAHPAVAATGFQLNFTAVLPTTNFGNCGQAVAGADCTIIGGDVPNGGGTLVGNDGTPFVQEELTINNTLYFHVVVGSAATGFANESYTRASLTSVSPNTGQTSGAINPFSPDSGGNEISGSSDPTVNSRFTNGTLRNNLPDKKTLFGNGLDPFGIGSISSPVSAADSARISGSGTGDPSRTVMRMMLSDSQMVQEVNKPLPDRKPLISQVTTDNAVMTSEFQADLRGLTYTQKDVNTPIINRLTLNLTGADALPTTGAADFDMTQVQHSTVTAGQFAYTAGAGWNTADGWSHHTVDPNTGNLVHDAVFSAGTYSGVGSSFNPLAVNWSAFFDPAQNPACNPNNSINKPTATNRLALGVCP